MPTPLWRLYEFVRISGGATRWFICRAASAADREAAAPDDTAGGQEQAAMIACRQLVRINVQQQPRVGRGIRGQMPEPLAAEDMGRRLWWEGGVKYVSTKGVAVSLKK